MNVNITYDFDTIAKVTKGNVPQRKSNEPLEHLLLDSRKLLSHEHTIFFSIQNSPARTEQFVKELYDKDLKSFVIDHEIDINEYPDANILLVKDALRALQLLAVHHRKQFDIPVIGITGSNGKTVVKEWLYQLLHEDFHIVRSPKSYNSQVGVPLSILQMKDQHTLGIFEAGISEPKEMASLRKMIRPSIAVFTNIGEAHSEGFKNIKQKIDEKLQLGKNSDLLIYCSDYEALDKEIRKTFKEKKQFFTWGKEKSAMLQIINIHSKGQSTNIEAKYFDRKLDITIPFTDEASIENAITCWCILLSFHIPDEKVSVRMRHLQSVEMRLDLKQGINHCSVINDSYSADINSLQIALDFLQQQKQHEKHTVILSDILQSGKSDKELYSEVAEALKQKHINRFIGIGPALSGQQQLFSSVPETHFFLSVEDFKKSFYQLNFHNEAILLKGARVFHFEQINNMLEQKAHLTILSINLSAVVHNLKQYKRMLQPSTKVMAMVKAFSYGSGGFEVAQLLQFNKIDYLAVAYADEGAELRRAGITIPIMVMNPEENTFNSLVEYFLEPELFSFSILKAFENYLISAAVENYPVHIKLDTGMHRLGFEQKDIPALAKALKNNPFIQVQSVFSHLLASDDRAKDELTHHQHNQFAQCCNELEKGIQYSFIKHIANTSAVSRHPHMQMDMVRLGIGLYGVDGDETMQKRLRNVTTLTTTISQIKNVKAGDTVGYTGNTILNRDSIIATVRIGYADGYSRALGNGKGHMLVKGKTAPVIGNVCMDMTMLDITDLQNVKEGDEVIVFGKDLPIIHLAKWSNTIPYEVMTGISQRVKRVYFEE